MSFKIYNYTPPVQTAINSTIQIEPQKSIIGGIGIENTVIGLNSLKLNGFNNSTFGNSELVSNDTDKKLEFGITEQELENILQNNNILNSGILSKDGEEFFGVRYNDFIAILIKSTQELRNIAEKQQKEIEELENIIKNNQESIDRLNSKII